MHDDRFDGLSRQLWQDQTRRRALRWLAVLPLLSPLGALLTQPDESAAQHPVRRVQGHTAKRRRRRNRQAEHKRDADRRERAPGSSQCEADKRRGDTCQQNCQCRGDYRCGPARRASERLECGQDPDAAQVCCFGRGDSCSGNDCECCGTLRCVKGRCSGCLAGDVCCPGGRCLNGECVANFATVGECQGRCDANPYRAFADSPCGRQAPCLPCDQDACERAGCSTATFGSGPQGFGYYCFGGQRTGLCPDRSPNPCPWGDPCALPEEGAPYCFNVCIPQ